MPEPIEVDLKNVAEVQQRFLLTDREFERAFITARRRSLGAGFSRVMRQLKRLTGEGQEYWKPNRVYAEPQRLTGAGEVWVGLNERRTKRGVTRRFPELADFDPEPVVQAMLTVWDAELEKAAAKLVRGGPSG